MELQDELQDADEELQDEEPYINAADGLELLDGPEDDLPRALILTNVRADVFEAAELREQLEQLCRATGATAFHWLRSFRRVRVHYAGAASAASARAALHRLPFPAGSGAVIGAYFAQPVTPAATSLQPPRPTKQFLISPPASPPLGWQPRAEGEPLVNHDLLAALAALAPGDCRELLPPQGSQPAIVVHAALNAQPTQAAQPSDCQ